MSKARFRVTFYNPLSGRRGVAIDDVSEEEADAVVERFGDISDPYTYLDEVRKEPMPIDGGSV